MRRVRFALVAVVAVLTTFAVVACGGQKAPVPPPPAPTPAQNCAAPPLTGTGAPARPVRHLAQASQQKVVKQGIRDGSACPNKLKPPPPKIHGLPTGVPKTGVPHKVPKGADPVEQFDSVDNNYPAGAKYGAGYVDGLYQTYQFVIGRFGVCCSVGIDVFAAQRSARATDLEPGNPGPSAAGPWAQWQIDHGNLRPMVYTMGSWWSDVAGNLAAYGIPHCSSATQTRCYLIWIASWNYQPGLWAGMDCRQWTDRALGINLDESTCGEWVYSSASVDARSYNMGYKTGYATSTSIPAKVGFNKTFHPTSGPASGSNYNSGYVAGYSKGWHVAANHGKASGASTPTAPTTYNGNFQLGYNNGWAIQVWQPFYNYWKLTRHVSDNSTAFNTGYVKGKPAGYNNDFNWGWRYGASGIPSTIGG